MRSTSVLLPDPEDPTMPILSPRATRRSIPDKAGRSRPSYRKSSAFTSMVSTSATGCDVASISSLRAHAASW